MATNKYMKNYIYKIQWLEQNKSNAKKLISILGARSLDKILTRDLDLNIIDEYTGFISYPTGLAEFEAKKWIEKRAKDKKVVYFEFLRK